LEPGRQLTRDTLGRMKVYPKSRLLDLLNAYPTIIAGLALLSGFVIAFCVLLGFQVPQTLLSIFMLAGSILLGFVAFAVLLLLIAGFANGVSWIVKRWRAT